MSEITETAYKDGFDMIYLAACALQNVVPADEVMEAMAFERVYRLAKSQTMAAVTFYGLERWEKAKTAVAPELWTKWKEAREKAIRKNLLFDIEREKLFSFLEKTGIWYLPLKGSVMKELYPQPGMRQMADNDILFDSSFRDEVYDYMIGQGYESDFYDPKTAVDVLNEDGYTVHDTYLKQPIYNFEMHMALFAKSRNPKWLAYYENVKERLQKDEGNGYGYHFRDEDFYVYMTAHASKHFNNGGHGLRNLMDVYVYLSQKTNLDRAYLERELGALELTEHEGIIRSLAEKLFGNSFIRLQEDMSGISEKEKEVLEICLSSGTYGTEKRLVENRLKEMSGEESITVKERLKYLFRRLIPEKEVLLIRYPKLARKKYLLPLCVLIRMGEGLLHAPKRLWREFTYVWKAKKK